MPASSAKRIRKPHRLKEYDYASAGVYFVTFCTANMKCFLSQIKADGNLILGIAGKIVDQEILRTEELRADFALIEYCVMPNHVHILFSLAGEHSEGKSNAFKERNGGSASAIVSAIKSAVTRRLRDRYKRPDLEVWHEKFHDHVVRDEADLDRIREYIINNPGQWAEDRYNPEVIARAQADREKVMARSQAKDPSHAQQATEL
jgi:putative transposase